MSSFDDKFWLPKYDCKLNQTKNHLDIQSENRGGGAIKTLSFLSTAKFSLQRSLSVLDMLYNRKHNTLPSLIVGGPIDRGGLKFT